MKNILSLFIVAFSLNAYAHGENKLGPHNGHIRMPGTYHTELVSENDGNFLVYLLDVNNQNPAVKDSTVEFSFKGNAGLVNYKCLPMSDYFHCVNEKKISNMTNAQIILKTKRLGIKGSESVYDLPLSLPPQADHSQMKH